MLFRKLYLLMILIGCVNALQFNLGQCLIYFNEPCHQNTTKFTLMGKTGSGSFTRIINPFKPALPEDYNFAMQTKIVIHGYGGITIDRASTNVTEAYQKAGYNVIEVNWSPLAATPCYISSFVNTWHVSQCVAILSGSLSLLGLSPEKLHVIGFSLGAHIASFASNNLENNLGEPFGRITGLDPALPFFATLDNAWKLDPGDARFVDVIHTSAGSFGKIEASGHVDFYVNGGYLQPCCQNARYPPLCSHLAAGLYFAESITSMSFVAVECNNIFSQIFGYCDRLTAKIAIMGEHCDITSRGVFLVNTDSKPPFALG